MGYLDKYGSGNTRKFQDGGAMPAAPGPGPAPVQAGPSEAGDGGQEEQIMALAQATVGGDQAAAAQLGTLLAPMIIQEVQAQSGGSGGGEDAAAAAPAPEGQPVFRKGGKFAGTIK
jgi:hypothetical protein